MITVNSLSGGKTSSYMAIHSKADINVFACVCIDYAPAAPKDPFVLKYALEKLNGDFIASAEHEKTLKVMMQLEQELGKEIIWVRGESFDTVIDNAGCLPTWKRRFCTTELKMIPIFRYIYYRFGKTNMRIGFRADEMERIISFKSKIQTIKDIISQNVYSKRNSWKEMVEWRDGEFPLGRTFHREILKYWANRPEFDFPLDSNCRGCHHKPAWLINQNQKETPEILEWFAIQEERKKGLGRKIHTWHDDLIPYRQKFKMNFTEQLDFNFTMCNSGGCTD